MPFGSASNRTPGGHKHLLGLFQHYDYLKNEIIHMGGTSLTGGLISLFPLGSRFELNMSLQLGPMLFGASNNKYTLIEQRDYNYGMGATRQMRPLAQPSEIGNAHAQAKPLPDLHPGERRLGGG